MKKRTLQLVCTYGVFVINGMLALSIGSLLPFVRDYLNLDYDFSGMIVSCILLVIWLPVFQQVRFIHDNLLFDFIDLQS